MAGLWALAGGLAGGPAADPAKDAAAWAAQAGDPLHLAAEVVTAASLAFVAVGSLSLHGFLRPRAPGNATRYALTASVFGLVLLGASYLGVGFGEYALARLYEQGAPAAAQQATTLVYLNPMLLAVAVSGLLVTLTGSILFAVALWKDGRAARWVPVLLAAWPVALFFRSALPFPGAYLPALLMAALSFGLVRMAARADETPRGVPG